ncbi:MAG: hypothetical protein ABIA93_00610, partial [Candidatus Woesearchaeota archaeon]
ISNTGPSDINYVTFTLLDSKGYEVVGPRQKYIGNLQSDDFETEQFSIHIADDASRDENLTLHISYRDSYNRPYDDKVELLMHVYSTGEARKLGLLPAPNISGWIIFIIILVLVVGIWYWRRKRHKRK